MMFLVRTLKSIAKAKELGIFVEWNDNSYEEFDWNFCYEGAIIVGWLFKQTLLTRNLHAYNFWNLTNKLISNLDSSLSPSKV